MCSMFAPLLIFPVAELELGADGWPELVPGLLHSATSRSDQQVRYPGREDFCFIPIFKYYFAHCFVDIQNGSKSSLI